MNAIASPAAKDPDELIDRFVHYVGLFEESASRADAWEHKVTVMKEDLDDARNATQKVKEKRKTDLKEQKNVKRLKGNLPRDF